MKKEYNSCDDIKSYFNYYTVAEVALLWCGVSQEELHEELSKATPISETTARGQHILKHPYISCMEPRCKVLQEAINNDELPVGRDGGESRLMSEIGHVAYARRTLKRKDIREWIEKTFPNDKPAFLFDEIERSTHHAINADSFRALQADRDALQVRIDKATEEYRKLRQELNTITGERDSLRKIVDDLSKHTQATNTPDPRSETTYLNIIGSMLDVMLGKSPAGKKHSIYDNQASIISALLAYHEGKQGIAPRTLEQKFANAKKSLNGS